MCQYALPGDSTKLSGYEQWIKTTGMKTVSSMQDLHHLTAYRDYGTLNPGVIAMLFFPDIRTALQVADSQAWRDFAAGLAQWGCGEVYLTVLVPSPILPTDG